jgi:AraC family transcriptional regulator
MRSVVLTVQPPQLPENVLSVAAAGRAWNGVQVDVTGFHCAGQVLHALNHTRRTRLSVVLEEVDGYCEPRLRPDRPNPIDHLPRHMHFAPAGLETWGYTPGVRYVKDATLSFDLDSLRERLQIDVAGETALDPRLRFADDRLWTLVRMLSEVVDDPDPSTQLYGDGLTTAIAARLFASSPGPVSIADKGLAPWRLKRVIDFLQVNLPQRVELATLAELAGLSPWYFSRAFKASTGMSPYHWQLDARIRQAQAALIQTDAALEQIADAAGFADAVHFGRTFRKIVGSGPAAWRRDRKR